VICEVNTTKWFSPAVLNNLRISVRYAEKKGPSAYPVSQCKWFAINIAKNIKLSHTDQLEKIPGSGGDF
jgi:hypothetical protein